MRTVLAAGGVAVWGQAPNPALLSPSPFCQPCKLGQARGSRFCCDWLTEAPHTAFPRVLSGNIFQVRDFRLI